MGAIKTMKAACGGSEERMGDLMGKRVLLVVSQPCVLCEETLYDSALWRDDDTGAEEWSDTPPRPHVCSPMQALLKERGAGPR